MLGSSSMLGSGAHDPRKNVVDTSPTVRPAGKLTHVGDEGTHLCMNMDNAFDKDGAPIQRPSTPPEIKKYRQSSIHEPGKIVKHYGLYDDPVKEGPFGFVPVVDALGVNEVLRSHPTSELMKWDLENRESIYESAKREPLGRSMTRGHVIPTDVHTFGTKIDAKAKDKAPESKSLIYPTDSGEEVGGAGMMSATAKEIHDKYVMTHGDYAPGEQRRRGYNWKSAGFKPETHVFGISEKEPYHNGVAKALNQTQMKEQATRLVTRAVSDFKLANTQSLGKSKNLGQRNRNIDAEHVFGVPSRRVEEWGVQQLIGGNYSEEDQKPDPDLGKSLTSGFRNAHPSKERVFGAPTIRTDLMPPLLKSVADNQNYGNEPDSFSLIYPVTAADRGLDEDDFARERDGAEMASILRATGLLGEGAQLSEEAFKAAYSIAAQSQDSGMCSIKDFLKVKHDLDMKAVLGF